MLYYGTLRETLEVVLASVTQSQVLEVKRKCHLKGTDTATMAEESDDTLPEEIVYTKTGGGGGGGGGAAGSVRL